MIFSLFILCQYFQPDFDETLFRRKKSIFVALNLSLNLWKSASTILIIPRRSRRDIVLASSSVRPFLPSVRTFFLSGTISQYLLVRFDSFLVQMISTMDSRYPISLVKIDPLTLGVIAFVLV